MKSIESLEFDRLVEEFSLISHKEFDCMQGKLVDVELDRMTIISFVYLHLDLKIKELKRIESSHEVVSYWERVKKR